MSDPEVELAVKLGKANIRIGNLEAALRPFSDMAGEMFSRNWHANQIVTVLDNPNDPHRITAGDYFMARLALSQKD